MSSRKLRRRPVVATLAVLGLFTGCGGEKGKPETDPVPKVVVETAAVSKPDSAKPGQAVASNNEAAPKYRQSFEQAAILDDIPEDQQAPPDKTLAGKATGPIRAAVEKLWPLITVLDESGKPVPFVVKIETSEGDIEITLRPDLAPNHVRNWLALIKTGFYDGLCFDRAVRESFVDTDGKQKQFELVRGGCPLGTGEPGIGHLGYFMKPEFTPSEKHEEGTVGFWRDAEPTSAGCRFYVSLTPAVTLDGEYTIVGKVTKGIEVVKKIASKPVLNPTVEVERERPKEPVVFKKVTVSPDRVEWSVPVAHLQDRETQR